MYFGAFGMFGTNPTAGTNGYAYAPTMPNTQVYFILFVLCKFYGIWIIWDT